MNNYFDVFSAYHKAKNQLGKYLKELKESEEFVQLSGLDNWYDFIQQPEVDLTSQEINKLISSYDFLCQNNLPLDISQRRISLLKKTNNPEEIFEETKLLTYNDMKERIIDIKNEKENNPNNRSYKYIIMQKCNETNTLKRVVGVESEEILNKFKINENGIRYE